MYIEKRDAVSEGKRESVCGLWRLRGSNRSPMLGHTINVTPTYLLLDLILPHLYFSSQVCTQVLCDHPLLTPKATCSFTLDFPLTAECLVQPT